MTNAAAAVVRANTQPPTYTAASTSGASTSAEATRKPSSRAARSATRRTVAPLALLELGHRAFKLMFGKVRPQGIGEHELGVRQLPQKKVAEPLFAAGPDQEIGIRHIGGFEEAR